MKRNISSLALYSEIAERVNLRFKSMIDRKILPKHADAGYITIWKCGESSPCYKVKFGANFVNSEFMQDCYDNSDVIIKYLISKRQLCSGYVSSLQCHHRYKNNVAIIFQNNHENYVLAISGLPTVKDNFILAVLAITQNYNDLNDKLISQVITSSGYEAEFLSVWNTIVAI